MKEHWDHGLCYNRDDKWAPGHKCKSTRLFLMEGDEISTENHEPISEAHNDLLGSSTSAMIHNKNLEDIELGISIHALAGVPNSKIVRLLRQIHGRKVFILMDKGSTHNFLDPSIFNNAQLCLTSKEGLSVKIANC